MKKFLLISLLIIALLLSGCPSGGGGVISDGCELEFGPDIKYIHGDKCVGNKLHICNKGKWWPASEDSKTQENCIRYANHQFMGTSCTPGADAEKCDTKDLIKCGTDGIWKIATYDATECKVEFVPTEACSNANYKAVTTEYQGIVLDEASQKKFMGKIKSEGDSALAGLSDLKCLTSIEIEVMSQVSDISALSSLTNLESLSANFNRISDLSPLSGLTKLKRLNLQGQYVDLTNLSPLSSLTNLETLNLASNDNLSDISALDNMGNMSWLYLQQTSVPMADCQAFKNKYPDAHVGCGDSLTGWLD
ncbi:MAG: leucine-rich repeat domain-containing protein [Candidatus Diapherotrites archaeon]